MRQEIQQMIEKLYKQYVKRKRWHKVVMALAAIVVFCTTYALVLPAITAETNCGIEEHTHEAVCYANEDIEGLLVCVLEEHTHEDSCYQKDETEEVVAENEDEIAAEEVVEEEIVEESEEIIEDESDEIVGEEETKQEEIIEEDIVEEETKENIATEETVEDDTTDEIVEEEVLEETIEEETKEVTEEKDETPEIIIETTTATSEALVMYGAVTTDEGDEITWEIIPNSSGSYTLKVLGNGAIPDNFIEIVPELAEKKGSIGNIIIGNGITSIGQYAFYKIETLESVDFETGSVLEVIGGSAFAQCKALETVELQKCTSLKTIEDSADGAQANGTFANTALTSIQFPNDMERIGANAFYDCDGLTNLYISNVTTIGNSAFCKCSNLKTVEITGANSIGEHCFYLSNNLTNVKLTNIAGIEPYAFKWIPTLTSIQLKNVISLGTGVFEGESNLLELDLDGTTNIGMWTFKDCPNLTSLGNTNSITSLGWYSFANSLHSIKQFNYTRDAFPALTSVAEDSFSNNKFEELTIGNLPLNNRLFANSSKLKEVTFETKFNQSYDLFAESTSKFKAIISTKVDEFYDANLRSISPYASSLHFEGPNYLTISHKDGFETNDFPEPLTDLNGNYYADAQGVLYQLNADGTATLIYCPPELTTYTVLSQISKEDGSGIYTVTSVDEHAFALAADLASLNGKTAKEEAASELNSVFNLAEGASLSKESFANTALTGKIDSEGETDDPDAPENNEELPFNGTVTNAKLFYGVQVGDNVYNDVLTIYTSDNGTFEEKKEFTYYTGEMNQTSVTVSPRGVSDLENKVMRLYLKASNPGIEFALETQSDGETFVIAGKEIKRKKLDDGSYYIDLPVITGDATFNFELDFTYPSPTTPGGTVYLWGAILDKEAAQAEANALQNGTQTMSPGENNNCHKMTWVTSEDRFAVGKTAGTAAKLKSSNGEAVVSDLNFTITTERSNADDQVQNKGENFVTRFEYVDTMTLPQGITWRQGIVDAISDKEYTWADNKIIVTLANGKTYTLAEYMLNNNNLAMEDFNVTVNSEGKIQIALIVKNIKKDNNGNLTETDTPNIQLKIGNDVLIGDLVTLGNVTSVTISNNVKLTPYYTYQKESITTTWDAFANVSIGGGDITLTKTHDRNSGTLYWGEDINYTVTLKNESVFNASGYGILEDALNQYTYITAENLQKMFIEDTAKQLKVRITNATLYEKSTKTTGTAVDGTTSVSLTPQNTGLGVENYYNGTHDPGNEKPSHMISNGSATITFQWQKDEQNNVNLVMWAANDGVAFVKGERISLTEENSIKNALDRIGYTITSQSGSVYTCTWDLTDVVLQPGEILEYEIPVTIKDTFMLLGKDLVEYHNQFAGGRTIDNKVILKDEDGIQVKDALAANKTAYHEVTLKKNAYSDGKKLENGFEVMDNAVIDYSLLIEHRGIGQYDVLPVVDHMEGGNVLLAKVSDNSSREWATGLPIETIGNVQYYVLNREGTYNLVKLGDYWASDVQVKKTTEGLDTIIHWYFTNTPEHPYTRKLAYKALVSRSYADIESPGFSVNNEVWLNDHHSHRLYNTLFGGGTMLVADKKIYLPATQECVTHSMLNAENSDVVYKLTLENVGNMAGSINGQDMYDALPNTYGSFTWTKGTNVNIVYSDNVTITNKESWTIESVSPENQTTSTGQYYICWGDDFKATVPVGETLTITVTLNFPTGTKWGEYFNVCNGNLLYNSFYVYHMSVQVSHDLIGHSSAKLQKGVYDVATMSYSFTVPNKRDKPYVSTGTRHIYGNLTNRNHIVTYYVSLHNDGTNRLYLNDITDILPEGFGLLYLRPFADIGINGGLGRPYTMMSVNESFSCKSERDAEDPENVHMLSSIDSSDITYLQTSVTGTVIENSNGRQKIRFTFSGYDLDSSRYDAERDQYYLKPGEAIRFGYSVDTGFEKNSVDVAVNTIMMPFTDYTGQGLDISELEVEASDLNGLNPNDGNCVKITDEQAAAYGFVREDGDTHNQWLASEVTLTRGKILPGIRKTAVNSNASIDAEVQWNIQTHNDGTGPLNDYVVTDEIESPYKFIGEVSYEIYLKGDFVNGTDGKPKPVSKSGTATSSRLFNIYENNMDTDGDIVLKDCVGNEHVLTKATGYIKEFECHCLLWYNDKYEQNTLPVKVSFEKTANGNQKINIHFLSSLSANPNTYKEYWGIPAGGYGNLKISVKNESGIYSNKPYVNRAWMTPVGLNRDFSQNPDHGNLTSLNIYNKTYPSVVSEASVNVSTGYFTTSEIRIKESDSNKAASTDEKNYIIIDDKTSTFRYELEVTTPVEVDPTKFVLIDNLPETGDHTTFGTSVPRRSEFKIDFAQEPNVSVKITDPNGNNPITLNPNQYQIGYSTATTYTSADWDGTSAWGNDSANARSIRVVITDPEVLNANSKIILSFDAVINDANAMPGQTAWNSFGYHYEVIKNPGEDAIALEAAPLPVGIRFPSVPEILKKLQNLNGEPYTTDERLTFNFLIYKGNAVKELDNISSGNDMITQLRNTMASKGISQYFLQEVTVPAGSSESAVYKLIPTQWYLFENGEWKPSSASQIWVWEDDAQYTVVELPIANTDFEYDSMNGLLSRSYTFTYDIDKTERITAINKYRTWDLVLSKVDSKDYNNLLANAVIALYSPNPGDAELYISETSDNDIAAKKEAMGISDVEVAKQMQVGSQNYYLKDIIQTVSAETHKWNELTEKTYVLQELRAPNGYNLDNRLHIVSREPDCHVEYTITNEAGYELPESGGMGISGITMSGAALMLTATAGAVVNKITSKRRKKGGEQ